MDIYVNCRFLTQKVTGAQRFAIEISRQLKKLNPNINFISPKNIVNKNVAQELNVKILGKNTGYIWEQVDLPLYLKTKGNPLLINLVNVAPLIYKNQVVTIHDISWKHFPDSVSRQFYAVYSFLIPRIAKNSRHIFTVSEFSKKDISSQLGIPEEKFTVIYNSVSKHFRRLFTKKEKLILSVATLQPYKNLESLIKAFISLKNKGRLREYKLYLVGGINRKVFSNSNISRLVEGRGDIHFTGYVSDDELVKLYNTAEAFVLPSKFEGFGIPPLEAMACGTPVIVSNAGSLPEVCGDAAYYVNPYSTEDIAKGIERVINDKKLQMELIEKGLKRVKLFSWEKSAKKLMETVEKIL
jgi:glycosyltransferase involved in cell wall biosynthesis